jgi:hypothetical protein
MKVVVRNNWSGQLGALGTGNHQDRAQLDELAGGEINLGHKTAPLRFEQTNLKLL